MKKIITVIALTLIHAIISISIFLIAFSYGMNRFDTGELPSLGERILNTISTILLWPIFYPLARWGGKEFRNIFHGVFGYIPLVINSFVWALFICWIYVKIKINNEST